MIIYKGQDMKFDKNYKERSARFIEVMGTKKICEICKITPQALTGWKRRGIPLAWSLYFSLKFKKEWSFAFNK